MAETGSELDDALDDLERSSGAASVTTAMDRVLVALQRIRAQSHALTPKRRTRLAPTGPGPLPGDAALSQ